MSDALMDALETVYEDFDSIADNMEPYQRRELSRRVLRCVFTELAASYVPQFGRGDTDDE